MLITITDTIRIRYETMNYTIEKKAVVGEGPRTKAGNLGAIRWDVIGYYGDLTSAAKSLLGRHANLLLESNPPKDLKQLIDAIDCGAELITSVLRDYREQHPVPESALE